MRGIIFVVFYICSTLCFSQDPQFSQYYNAPLLLNPAFTGATDCYRVGMNARTQWTGLPGGSFNTASVFMDMNYSDLRSGFGLLVLHDNIGTPKLTSNEVSGFYSYHAAFSDRLNFRFGLQATYVSRNIDYSRLIFEDQFSGTAITNPSTMDPIAEYGNVSYGDFSSGLVVYGEDKYWLGFSAHHLNRPEQSFYMKESRLPIKYSIHGGINFYYRNHPKQRDEEAWRIIPTFMYKGQAKFDQLDVGVYVMKFPILLGAWYRGIFFKEDEKIRNNDAFILQAGYQYQRFSFAYSYDFTISKLNMRNTHGSHEISLIYLFCADWPVKRKPPRRVRKLPCPDWQRSLKFQWF